MSKLNRGFVLRSQESDAESAALETSVILSGPLWEANRTPPTMRDLERICHCVRGLPRDDQISVMAASLDRNEDTHHLHLIGVRRFDRQLSGSSRHLLPRGERGKQG